MKLVGRKRKVLTVAATMAAATGLVVGLAGTAAAVPPPPAPPGTAWVLDGTQCLTRQPFPTPGQHYSPGGSCVAGSEMVGGRGVGDPIRFETVWGTTYQFYSLRSTGPVDRAPVGYLDACDSTHVHGWAKDPDWAGSLDVHLYNQNGFVNGFSAAVASEPGTGGTNQRFVAPHGQPSGSVLTVYALGRDAAGGGNGVNPQLPRPVGGGTSCVVP